MFDLIFHQAKSSRLLLARGLRGLGLALSFGLAASGVAVQPQSRSIKVAVLDFGSSPTGARAAASLRGIFGYKTGNEFSLVDSDLAGTAAHGAGFEGSLNLTTQEARDIGAAIGCEFYFIGDAQTFRRVPSTGAPYFESFASIFLVSARTGRLILWERPLERQETAAAAEKALLQSLSSGETRLRYQVAIGRALEDERAQRESAVA